MAANKGRAADLVRAAHDISDAARERYGIESLVTYDGALGVCGVLVKYLRSSWAASHVIPPTSFLFLLLVKT